MGDWLASGPHIPNWPLMFHCLLLLTPFLHFLSEQEGPKNIKWVVKLQNKNHYLIFVQPSKTCILIEKVNKYFGILGHANKVETSSFSPCRIKL